MLEYSQDLCTGKLNDTIESASLALIQNAQTKAMQFIQVMQQVKQDNLETLTY